ncbi:glucosaminidase domain-containing protein [Vagococcus coleopterorum]|nr:glucosaminidase domain-containing protein [Vagococcus coleopterorum]
MSVRKRTRYFIVLSVAVVLGTGIIVKDRMGEFEPHLFAKTSEEQASQSKEADTKSTENETVSGTEELLASQVPEEITTEISEEESNSEEVTTEETSESSSKETEESDIPEESGETTHSEETTENMTNESHESSEPLETETLPKENSTDEPRPSKPNDNGSSQESTVEPEIPDKPSKEQIRVSGSEEAITNLSGNAVEDNYYFSVAKNQTTTGFINAIRKDATEIAWKNDLYASVMISQAILETGSGNSLLSSKPNYNLFGVKGSYKGSSVTMPTSEDNGSGKMYTINSGFRKYPSYKESLEDYAILLKKGIAGNPNFYKNTWKSNAKSYRDVTAFLTGRYATDTRYAQKLNAIITTYKLTQYDNDPKTVFTGKAKKSGNKNETKLLSNKQSKEKSDINLDEFLVEKDHPKREEKVDDSAITSSESNRIEKLMTLKIHEVSSDKDITFKK